MADVFQDGDKITSEFLNKVSKTVTDGCGDKTTPTDVRLFIGAEKAGAAGAVQSDLDSFKAQKGVANGLCPLDGSAKVPASYLPATGSDYTFETQADMLAGGTTMLEGQVATVYADPTPALNGQYIALQDNPTLIEHYHYTGGDVAPHTHTGAEVSVTSAVGGPDLQAYITANDVLVQANTDANAAQIPDDAPSDGKEYLRKNAAWTNVTIGTGDLKSDGSVPMAGAYTPTLAQDIATKGYSDLSVKKAGDTMTGQLTLAGDSAGALQAVTKQEMDAAISTAGDAKVSKAGDTMTGSLVLNADATADMEAVTKQQLDANFNKYMVGPTSNGKVSRIGSSTDLNTVILTGHYPSSFGPTTANNWPEGVGNYGKLEVIADGGDFIYQEVRSFNDNGATWTRTSSNSGSAWTDWRQIDAIHQIDSGTSLPTDTTGYAEGDVFIVTA